MSESRVRENRTHGSIGGRWRNGRRERGPLVPGRCAEKRHHHGPVGTSTAANDPPSQRPTSPASLATLPADNGAPGKGRSAAHVYGQATALWATKCATSNRSGLSCNGGRRRTASWLARVVLDRDDQSVQYDLTRPESSTIISRSPGQVVSSSGSSCSSESTAGLKLS